MLRHLLLPALAASMLAGCATDYAYRNSGGGDYYYGQPRIEYRYYGPYGFYRDYGYGGYYYDAFGRLVYASPYGYYGYPYGGYGNGWYRPRPHPGHGDHGNDHDAGQDDDRAQSGPPWRDLGTLRARPPRAIDDDEDARPRMRRQSAPLAMPAPLRREPRMIDAPMPRASGGETRGSRMGSVIRRAKAAEE